MRRITALIAALLTLALLASCGGSGQSAPGTGGAGPTRPELNVGYTVVPLLNIDPAKSSSMTESNFEALVVETLVKVDQKGQPQPLLADSWKLSDDQLTWTFNLHKGIKFQDGTPFNADAVKYTFDRILDKATAAPFANNLAFLESVTVKDENTVAFKTKKPYAPMLSMLSSGALAIVSPTAAKEQGLDKFSTHPVGTGPYKVESFVPKQPLVVLANDEYWGTKPSFTKITVKSIPEESAATAALLNGEVDMIWRMPLSQVDALKGQAQVQLLHDPAYTIEYIGFNVTKAPLDKKEVRQAIAQAVDVKQIVQDGMFGYGTLTTGPIGPTVWGFDPNIKGYDYNPEQAKQKLQAAGVTLPLKLTYLIWADAEKERVAQILQDQLKKAGIELTIDKRDFGTFLKEAAAGNDQLFTLTWANSTGDVDFNFLSFDSGTVGRTNFAFYKSEKFDQLNAQQRATVDVKARQQVVSQALQLLKDDAPWIGLATQEWLVAVRKNVQNFKIYPSGNFYLEGVTKS